MNASDLPDQQQKHCTPAILRLTDRAGPLLASFLEAAIAKALASIGDVSSPLDHGCSCAYIKEDLASGDNT